MRIGLAQLNFHIGNFEENTAKIIQHLTKAKQDGLELLVFPELAICGYPPRDFLDFEHFVERCLEGIQEIAKHCVGIAAIIGSPVVNKSLRGKRLHNAAFFLCDGRIESVHHKTLLPNYDIFDEYRYFEPAKNVQCIDYKGIKIALSICEDIWGFGDASLYVHHPMDELIKENPSIAINIAASPFSAEQHLKREAVLKQNAQHYKLPFLYVNHVGAQTELIFDGNSGVAYPDGTVHAFDTFTENVFVVDTTAQLEAKPLVQGKIEGIEKALIAGLQDYFRKLGFKKAILGLSGGIDSAVTLALASKALGSENVTAVLMPSQYSSDHSISDSLAMVHKIGCPHYTIPIQDTFTQFTQALAEPFKDTTEGLAEENLQARIRGTLLMAMANKHHMILLNTSNKSEAAVGYGTLYGDMCGGLSVIADVYKTDVYDLARYLNRNGEIIPNNIITKEPSAELRPDQKDSDSLPPYDILDRILYAYIEESQDPENIIKMGFDKVLVDRVLKLVNMNEYKRYQTPPILRVSSKAFGMGRRMPIVAKYLN